MLHAVKKVEYIKDYKLKLTFRNNEKKVVDLENELWGPMFEPLKDIDYFKQVQTDGYTIMWPNEVDFCPDVLYSLGKNVEKLVKKHVKKPIPRKKRQVRVSSTPLEMSRSIAAKSKS